MTFFRLRAWRCDLWSLISTQTNWKQVFHHSAFAGMFFNICTPIHLFTLHFNKVNKILYYYYSQIFHFTTLRYSLSSIKTLDTLLTFNDLFNFLYLYLTSQVIEHDMSGVHVNMPYPADFMHLDYTLCVVQHESDSKIYLLQFDLS